MCSMMLHDRSTQHNTWRVRMSQHTGWCIIIKSSSWMHDVSSPTLEYGTSTFHHINTRGRR